MSDGACVASHGSAAAIASRAGADGSPAIAIALLNVALVTMIGSCLPGDLRLVIGIPVTVAGCVLAWAAAVRIPIDPAGVASAIGRSSLQTAAALLSIAAAVGLGAASLHGPVWYEALYRAHSAIAIVTVGIAAADNATWRRRAVLVTVSTAVVLQLLTPIALPHPSIDVWSWIQSCGSRLLAGVHPYTFVAPDPYGGAYDFGSTPPVFPYMPGMLLAVAPAIAVFGDYRFGIALCLPFTVLLLRATASRLRADERLTALLTLALVLHPRGAQMTANGFPEPLLMVAIAAFAWCSAAGRDLAAGAAFFCIPAIKQYFLAPLALFAATGRRRAAAVGAAVAVATVLPFVIWNPRATVEGMLFFVNSPLGFREDSDSLVALLAHLNLWQAPRWLAVVAQFVAAGIAGWLLRGRGDAGLLLASALALYSCFLLATQAFVNYYAFVAVTMVFAALLFARREGLACA